ncbi:alpha/beta hydrolase [Haloferula sp. BvORR071]|uniref:alpha/beta fold hydrolase n=1 Tax=Haloferula sp. BvORR071 TaxID=1396141 RepID=UPI00069612E7|nr:alpha/beta hydrolase [Haloferula sp. BvORR071]
MPTLQRPNTPLYYETAGDSGPPVLLIQGVGVTGEGWRRQVDALSRNHRTLVFDNRGIGRSQLCSGPISIEAMAEDARALMDEVGWESAHVVGHSMGGLMAQQMAIDAPKRVRSLAFVCSFARGEEVSRLTPRVLWLGMRSRIGTRAMRRNAFLEMLYSRDCLAASDRAELAAETARLVGRDLADSPPILMQQLKACGQHQLYPRLGELAGIPSLVISAEFDPIALPAYGRNLAEAIPGAEFSLHAGMAHGNLLEDPTWLNERLTRHFDTEGRSS